MSKSQPRFQHTLVLDGQGGATQMPLEDMPPDAPRWLHLHATHDAARRWILNDSGLDRQIAEAMVDDDTRPRTVPTQEGILVVLRGVNTNPGQDPEDMVSVRIWVDRGRIITIRRRHLQSVQDVKAGLLAGRGPGTPGGVLIALIERLADLIADVVDAVEARNETTDSEQSGGDFEDLIARCSETRRQCAALRRFLAPQRDALERLVRQPRDLFTEDELMQLQEDTDRTVRYLEDLELAREHSVVLQQEHLGYLQQQQNDRMYVLSVVAAIFLPLTFATGLLGMNVGGLPGIESSRGFVVSVVVMLALGGLLFWFFKWKKWI